MKQYILPGIVVVLIVLVVGLIVRGVFFKPANAGLSVDSTPSASVFLEGKNIGKTPFEDEKLQAGEKVLKLVPESTITNFYPWETKIKLVGGVITVVRREFGETEGKSSGEIIILEKIADKKTASLVVISLPDSSVVKINGETRGFTPLSLERLSEQDAEILISAPGFKERTTRTKLLAGFKTTVNVKLAESISETDQITGTPTPTPLATTTPLPTGKVTPKPTAKPTGPTPTIPPKPYVEIKATETGWLRVRDGPSKTATEVAKVYPGEKYSLLEEGTGWYKISYGSSKEGWVSGTYVEVVR